VKCAKITKRVQKRAFCWLHPEVHARAKAQAALSGKNLENWFAEAVQQKLSREEAARKTQE
jgi:hypothetical protein